MLTDTPDEYEKRINALTGKYLKAAKDAATAAGVPCDVVHVEHAHPYETVIDTARKRGCDAIVMASHGRRGVSAIVLGSETVKCSPTVLYRLSSFVRDAAAYCRASLRCTPKAVVCQIPVANRAINYDRHDLHYSLKRDGEKIAVRQGSNPSVVRIIFLQLQTNAKVRRQ